MGFPTIWFYPDPEGTLQAITLPHLSELVPLDDTDAATARARSGRTVTHVFSSFNRWRIAGTLVPGADDAVIRQMRAFEHHAKRGAPFAFTRDSDKAWAGISRRPVQRGDTTLLVSPFPLFNDSATLAADDAVVVESASPERFQDELVVDTFSSSSITVDSPGATFRFRENPIAVRYADYLPAVVKSEATLTEPILLDGGSRLVFRWELECIEAPGAIKALSQGGTVRGSTLGMGASSLQQLLDRAPPGSRTIQTGR